MSIYGWERGRDAGFTVRNAEQGESSGCGPTSPGASDDEVCDLARRL